MHGRHIFFGAPALRTEGGCPSVKKQCPRPDSRPRRSRSSDKASTVFGSRANRAVGERLFRRGEKYRVLPIPPFFDPAWYAYSNSPATRRPGCISSIFFTCIVVVAALR